MKSNFHLNSPFLLLVMIVSALHCASTNTSGEVNFTPYENNPVLNKGPSGSWDSGAIFLPIVVLKDKLYHMLYTGTVDVFSQPAAIGYATSPDGLSWTKHPSNPVLKGDGTGFDALSVSAGTVLVEGDTWILYYNARSVFGVGPGPSIGRATAPEPSGPWTRSEEPVLMTGSPGEWDSGFVSPDSVIATDEGYIMYYSGGANFDLGAFMIGMATSSDGMTWTKHDDPNTTAPPFAESEPVLHTGASGNWDSITSWLGRVQKTTNGDDWEMFYAGESTAAGTRFGRASQIGYATSTDGIHWSKYKGNPILVAQADSLATDAFLEVGTIVVKDSRRFLYYDYGIFQGAIGVAIKTTP